MQDVTQDEVQQEIDRALAGYTPPPALVREQRLALWRGVALVAGAFVLGLVVGAGALYAIGGA
jgi:hypothetical protein